jgi:hypothetical protein
MPNLAPNGTQSRSAQSFIQSSLRLVGALRSGNLLSAAELTDCLQVLNDFMDACSANRSTIFVVPTVTLDQNQNTLSLIAGVQTYTLGNVNENENFLLPRPPRLERVSIMYSASQSTPVELPMEMVDDVGWQSISNKSVTSILPQVCYVEEDFPDMKLSFWPAPTQANPVVLYPWAALAQFPDLQTPFSFPPGYARFIRYNLALDLAAEFPCDLTKVQLVQKIAAQAKSDIQSLNLKAKEAVCDEAIVGSYGNMGNIFTGTANRSLKN